MRAFIRREETAPALLKLGAAETALGNLYDDDSLKAALAGCSGVIHICPPMNPD